MKIQGKRGAINSTTTDMVEEAGREVEEAAMEVEEAARGVEEAAGGVEEAAGGAEEAMLPSCSALVDCNWELRAKGYVASPRLTLPPG